jgi:hypothetical protein
MIAKNVCDAELYKALEETNREFEGNVTFNRYPELIGKNKYRFTLRVISSKGKGARRGFYQRRRLMSACWHVHGIFFDRLFGINPDAVIGVGSGSAKKITKDNGNWQDWNAGSIVHPIPMSEMCDCESGVEIYTVKQSELTSECWLIQIQGLKACESCELKDTSHCGGEKIRVIKENKKGYTVPIGR